MILGPIDVKEDEAVVVPIGVAHAIRKRKADAAKPQVSRIVAEPGTVLWEFLADAAAWGVKDDLEWRFTPKHAREIASSLNRMARRAEDFAAEASGGPPILVALRKRALENNLRSVAKKHGTLPVMLCYPLAHGSDPSLPLVALWLEISGMVSQADVAKLWGVTKGMVSRTTRALRAKEKAEHAAYWGGVEAKREAMKKR